MSADALPRCPRCKGASVRRVIVTADPIVLCGRTVRLHSFGCGGCRFTWQKWEPAPATELVLT